MISARERVLAAGLRTLYDLLYHQLAWSYDIIAAAVSLGRWQTWVKACLPYLKGPRILEIGYGPGHLQKDMDARGLTAFGVDASPQMARMAHSRLLRRGVNSRITLGYAQFLPFSSFTFDQVVATFPSEYVVDPQALSEIYRILKPGGMLLVIPFAWLTGNHWYEQILTKLLHGPHDSPDWDQQFIQPLLNAGFSCSLTAINIDSSALLMIQATKDTES